MTSAFRSDRAWALAVFLCLTVLVLLGVAWLELWSQVRHWWSSDWVNFGWTEGNGYFYPAPVFGTGIEPGADPLSDDAVARSDGYVDYSHFLRRIVTFPFFWLGLQLGVDPHKVYSSALPACAALTYFLAARSAAICSDKALSITGLIVLLPIAALFIFMHGRMPLAFLGYALVSWAVLSGGNIWQPKKVLVATLGIFIAAVSSGTMLACLIIFFLFGTISAVMQKTLKPLLGILFVAAVFYIPIESAVIKAVLFYGGGLEGAILTLSHGFGSILFQFDSILLSLLVALCFLIAVSLLYYALVILSGSWKLPLLTLVTAALGAFGFSILALAVFSGTVMLVVILESSRVSKFGAWLFSKRAG